MRQVVAFLVVVSVYVAVNRVSGFVVSISDCVKYGTCADTDTPVLWGHDVVECFSQSPELPAAMGDDDYTVDFNGYQFWFKNETNMDKFKANPEKYAPRCGGFCAYGVACHGGDGVCANNGAVAVNASEGWAVMNGALYWFSHGARDIMLANRTYFAIADKNWRLWYPKNDRFNSDAFWPFADGEGESLCRTCGFEAGSSANNKLARNRKFFLGRHSGAVSTLSPMHAQPFPKSIHSWHAERMSGGRTQQPLLQTLETSPPILPDSESSD